MDNKSTKKPSLFDDFLDEINNEELQRDLTNDGQSVIGEMSTSDSENLSVDQYSNLNESQNYDVMLKAFDDAFETMYGDSEVSFIHVQKITEELQTNCIHLINKVKNQTDTIEIEHLRSKFALLENESQTTINKLQSQIIELNLKLKQQSLFSSLIGSTYGYYLWNATQIPAVCNMVLQEDKMRIMAQIMTSVLSSFIETHNNKMSSVKTCQTSCVLNILGIVANLTITKAGCHFFSKVNDGICVIDRIVCLVNYIPSSLENNLKKVAYAALYNISIQFNGHLHMQNNKLLKTLNNDIRTILYKGISETLLFALKLVQSLTKDINEPMYVILKNEINIQEILKLTRYPNTELIARKIYENISIANEKYNDTF